MISYEWKGAAKSEREGLADDEIVLWAVEGEGQWISAAKNVPWGKAQVWRRLKPDEKR